MKGTVRTTGAAAKTTEGLVRECIAQESSSDKVQPSTQFNRKAFCKQFANENNELR